jgi:hypothetical protein
MGYLKRIARFLSSLFLSNGAGCTCPVLQRGVPEGKIGIGFSQITAPRLAKANKKEAGLSPR